MMRRYRVLLASGLIFALCGVVAQGQPAPQGKAAAKSMVTLEMPAIPDPVPVTLNHATTALLVFDYVDSSASPSGNVSTECCRR